MKIDNSFTIDVPISEAWDLLTDIAWIAPCLPGAKLTDEVDGVYSGSVKIKVGPVTAEYRGSAKFIERDDLTHKAVIDGKGRDSRGAGNAQALISAQMFDQGDQTQVDISTELKITGKVAQFGRGVMQDVSEKLLGQFADCLSTKLEGTSALEEIASVSAADATSHEAPVPTASDEPSDGDDALDLLDVAGGAVFKRLVPMALLLIALVAVLILVLG